MFSVMIKHTYAGSIWNELCSILLKRYIYEDLHYRQYPLVQKLPVKSWSLGSEKSWLHNQKWQEIFKFTMKHQFYTKISE